MLSQILINGLIAGAIYSLIAVGFSLIYSTAKFIHLAHGSVVVFAGYFLYLFYSRFSFNFWLSAILAIIIAISLGWLSNELVYKPLRKRKAGPAILLIAGIALLILFESVILLAFGADVKTIGFIKISKGLQIGELVITPLQIIIILSAIILLAVFFFFMKKSRLGKAMRAVSDNKEVAEIVGISVEKIYKYSFIIGSAIGGIAGILVSLEQNLEPTMGTNLIIRGFTGAVIGGIGSVPGAVLGSFILGLVENIGIWFLPSGYKDAIAFAILFIFLLFWHRGLLGKKR